MFRYQFYFILFKNRYKRNICSERNCFFCFAIISYETNFQCGDILILYFAYLLKLDKDKETTGKSS